jgi:hypothetical protein
MMREFGEKVKESFQEVANKLEWASKLRASLALIRQLEFALTRLQASLDQMLVALQFTLSSRVPANLLPPPIFRDILANITLGLPENFELAGGSQHHDLAWFYVAVTATVVASPTGFWLALAFPLKDVSAQFELNKDYTYVVLHLEKRYLAINVAQNSRLDLSESDLKRRREHTDFMICPADHSVLNYDHKTCLLSLYLQLERATRICERHLHTNAPEPFLLQQGSTVVFFTATASWTFFRCKQGGRHQTTTHMLRGAGLIEGAASCHLSTDGVQLRPVLRVESRFAEAAPPLFAPAVPLLHQEQELQAIRQFINSSYFGSLATCLIPRPNLVDITPPVGDRHGNRPRGKRGMLDHYSADICRHHRGRLQSTNCFVS